MDKYLERNKTVRAILLVVWFVCFAALTYSFFSGLFDDYYTALHYSDEPINNFLDYCRDYLDRYTRSQLIFIAIVTIFMPFLFVIKNQRAIRTLSTIASAIMYYGVVNYCMNVEDSFIIPLCIGATAGILFMPALSLIIFVASDGDNRVGEIWFGIMVVLEILSTYYFYLLVDFFEYGNFSKAFTICFPILLIITFLNYRTTRYFAVFPRDFVGAALKIFLFSY